MDGDDLSYDILSAIGLRLGWKSFACVAGIPPFIIVILFKVHINRVFARPFRYHVPTEAELRNAQVPSKRGNIEGNHLEKRFGHPALHAKLFTPMLHAGMMPLLPQVYSGRIDIEQTELEEYGEQQTDVRVLPGGNDPSDLEYDPVLYQHDRGEPDWDQQSIVTALDSTSGFPASGRNSPASLLLQSSYSQCFSQEPSADSDVESGIGPAQFIPDQQPLLPSTLAPGSGQSSRNSSGYSSPQPQYADIGTTQHLPETAYHGRVPSGDGCYELPTHRSYSMQEPSRRS